MPRPPREVPVCPRWEARAILIELPNRLFKLDLWAVLTPGWDRRKPSASSAGTSPAGHTWPQGCRSRAFSRRQAGRLGSPGVEGQRQLTPCSLPSLLCCSRAQGDPGKQEERTSAPGTRRAAPSSGASGVCLPAAGDRESGKS